MLQFNAPLKSMAASKATMAVRAICATLAPDARPKAPTMVIAKNAPIMNTSPCAKLISSTMP
jgi:hypothetical protein